MKVNVEFPIVDDEGNQGVLKFPAELSGNIVKSLELFNTITVRTCYGMFINKIRED